MANQVGRFIVEKMRRDNLTYEQLEAISGISRSQLNNLVNKPEMTPQLPTLAALSKVLETPLYQLIEAAGFDLGFPDGASAHHKNVVSDVITRIVSVRDPKAQAEAIATAPVEAQEAIRTIVKAYLEQKL